MEGNLNQKTACGGGATSKQDPLFRRIVATRDLSYDGEDPGGGLFASPPGKGKEKMKWNTAVKFAAIALLTLAVNAILIPADSVAFDITTPTKVNGKGAPYLLVDPNTGAYVNPADRGEAPKALSEAELDADAQTAAEMKKYMRLFRYAYIGFGVQGSDIKQNGVSSSSTNYGGSMGLDIDGLVNPLTLELSGKFYGGGSGTSFGETFLMVYGEFPVSAAGGLPWSAPYRKTNMDEAYKRGKTYEQAARENWSEFTRFCEQFSPWRVGIGIGVGGFKLDQSGGSILINGKPVPGKTQISVAGIPLAARIGYFGKTDMVRLTGYYLDSGLLGTAQNGTEISDAFTNVDGVPSDYDFDADGKYIEARLDWYHRLDGRIADRKLLSGYGLSLIYRNAKVDGATGSFLGTGFTPATVEVPEVSAKQIELLVTIGYMR